MIFVCITISSECDSFCIWSRFSFLCILSPLHFLSIPLSRPVCSARFFSFLHSIRKQRGAITPSIEIINEREERDEKQRQIKKEESGRKDFGLAPKSTWIAGGRMERLVNWKRAEKQSSGQSGYLLLCSTRLCTNSLSFVDFVQLFPVSHCIAIIDALYSFPSLAHFVVQWIFFKQFHPPSHFSK